MKIIFSRDRPAQLDLLLRSIAKHAPGSGGTIVIWDASAETYARGYAIAKSIHHDVMWEKDAPFDTSLRRGLAAAQDGLVTFFCDDDVMFRTGSIPTRLAENVICHSLRLASARRSWKWSLSPRENHGYPCSIDGHTFRASDVRAMIGSEVISGPTMLETVMDMRAEVPLRLHMTANREQSLVGVPVNRVSPQSGCEHGISFGQDERILNDRWLRGERIVLDESLFTDVTSCHLEVPFSWEPR